jgi:Hypervirulence associated proteins TUDOR domain
MTEDLEKGDHVEWSSHGSKTEGTVEKKITDRTKSSGRTVAASENEPQFEVTSDKSGKTAVHKPDALKKK